MSTVSQWLAYMILNPPVMDEETKALLTLVTQRVVVKKPAARDSSAGGQWARAPAVEPVKATVMPEKDTIAPMRSLLNKISVNTRDGFEQLKTRLLAECIKYDSTDLAFFAVAKGLSVLFFEQAVRSSARCAALAALLKEVAKDLPTGQRATLKNEIGGLYAAYHSKAKVRLENVSVADETAFTKQQVEKRQRRAFALWIAELVRQGLLEEAVLRNLLPALEAMLHDDIQQASADPTNEVFNQHVYELLSDMALVQHVMPRVAIINFVSLKAAIKEGMISKRNQFLLDDIIQGKFKPK
jgi:hypothetical protein